jgi:hypothetical protein
MYHPIHMDYTLTLNQFSAPRDEYLEPPSLSHPSIHPAIMYILASLPWFENNLLLV